MPARPPTLRDIAREAGLAVSTVSLALRNRGTVCAETCARVQAIAQRLGYRANPLLAALASRRFRAGGQALQTPIVSMGESVSGYDRDLITEPVVFARAEQMGYRLEQVILDGRRSPAALGRQLYHRGVAGIILGQLYASNALPDLPWEAFCVVSRGRQRFPAPFPVVRWEIFNSMVDMWNRLRSRGYRRFGWAVLRHDPEHPDDRARLAAALYCIDHSPSCDRVPVLRCPISAGEECWEEVRVWARTHQPDLVVGFHSGIMSVLEGIGWRFPEQAGFVSLHTDTTAPVARIAGIGGDNTTLRLRALELLDLQIRSHVRGPQAEPVHMLLPGRWVEGTTVRPPS